MDKPLLEKVKIDLNWTNAPREAIAEQDLNLYIFTEASWEAVVEECEDTIELTEFFKRTLC